jgi:cytochrome P450
VTDVAPTPARSGILTGMLQEEVAQESTPVESVGVAMPPGPPLPRLLQTLGFIFAPAPFLDACRRRYGDVVTMGTLFDPKFVMVFDPEVVKQVFRGPHEQLRAGEANAPLGPVLGARSVLLLDGDEHLRQRRLMLPSFHGERMREYETVMTAAADRAIDSWPVGETFTLLPSMQLLTLDVIMHAVFGVEEGTRQEELKRRIRTMLDPVGSRGAILMMILSGGRLGVTGRVERFQRQRQAVDEMIFEEIARRRGADDLAERTDMLSMLLLATDEQGEAMTDAELRDELVTLVVAGHETTATGLAWAFELLLRNRAVLARAQAAVAEDDTTYLDAVVKETLRRRTVVPGVGRVVRGAPFQLNGYVIPPGIEINPSIAGMHRRADSYPDPTEFRPERFLGDDPPDTYTWIPFGGGTRRCLGASFATFEMRVVIARVLARAQLAAVGRPESSVRKGVTIVPRRGVRVVQKVPPRPLSVARDNPLTEVT